MLVTDQQTSGATRSTDDVLPHVETLSIGDSDTRGSTASGKAGEHHHVVDFVPSGTSVNEEQVALEASITLNLGCSAGGGEHKDLKRTSCRTPSLMYSPT